MTNDIEPAAEAPKNKRQVRVKKHEGESFEDATSGTLLSPEVSAALTMQVWENMHTVDGLRAALTEQIDEVNGGSLNRPEAMLLAQAHTLDVMFNTLAQKAHTKEYMPHYESLMRMAFKAQGQCRATLETLAKIKNPPVIFAKQANISNGHQQINNGIQTTRTEEIKTRSNKLLEHTHGERLDTGTKSEAISINSDLATLG